jgi:DNA-binding NarL/FixJ family response regulator
MIGRTSEQVLLHEEISRVLTGRGRLVFIGGEAGIGKTTLARDALADARRRGARVLIAHCHDLISRPPYAPWLDLALGYPAEPNLPAFPAAFSGGHLTEIHSQSALFAETLAFVTELSSTQPLVVLIEDLHWSDSASLELLRFLATRIAELPVLFLITYRLDELTRTHPLYQQLPGLIRAGSGLRLDLKRLDAPAIAELIRTCHRLPLDDELRLGRYLEQHAQGNPFFATELIRALEEAGILAGTDQGSRLDVLDRVILPSLLTQVIDARVGRLGESMRSPLSMAAVIGEEVPLDLWAEVAALSQDEQLAIVEQATVTHLLEANRDGAGVRFVHALTRDALYESILPPRRRIWHRAVADALVARPQPDPDAVAHHLSRAGDDRAPAWFVRAGDRAQRAYTWLIAAERFRSAADALSSVAGSERERGWLLFRAARLMRLAAPLRGIELLRESLHLASECGDALLYGDARYSIGLLRIYANDIGAGIAELATGIEMLSLMEPERLRGDAAVAIALADSLPQRAGAADSDLESSVALQRLTGINHRQGSVSWWYAVSGRLDEAIQIGTAYLAATKQFDNPGGLVQSATGHAYFGLGVAYAVMGQPERARSAFASARAVYRSLDHHGVVALAYLAELRHVGLAYDAEDIGCRNRLADETVGAIDQAGGAMPPGLPADVGRLVSFVIEGRWDEVLAIVQETLDPGNAFIRQELAEATALIAAHRGQNEVVWEQIRTALPDGPAQLFGSRLLQQALCFQRLAAEISLAEGQQATAHAWLEANDRWLAASDARIGAAEGKLAWAAYRLATGDAATAATLAAEALVLATEPRQPLAMLCANRLIGEIETTRQIVAKADAHLRAALDLADRCHAPYERALVLTALAELRCREGRHEESASHAEEAAKVFRTLRAEPALRRIAAIAAFKQDSPAADPGSRFGLTARETEVLKLVALGLTDSAVAAQLYISPRTVSQHLRSVYGKLSVSTRSAATRFAIEHDIA